MYNSGQGCVDIKRVIVVGGERGEQMLAALKGAFAAITVGDPTDEETRVGPFASERALDGLLRQIREAGEAGGTVVTGGYRVDRPGFCLEPTIITDITEGNPLYHEEAFGSVLSFYVVDSEEEAIRLANATRSAWAAVSSTPMSSTPSRWPPGWRPAWCSSTPASPIRRAAPSAA